MPDRYFVETPITGDRATLAGSEAHHLLHVMRAKVDDEVVLFDGSGAEWHARVEQVRRNEADLALLSRQVVSRELSRRVTLGIALPKGERQRWLVEKAVELGVGTLVPLATRRGVAQPTDGTLERLRRAVIEASRQCGRNTLMAISPGLPVGEFCAQATSDVRWLAHPGGNALREEADRQLASSAKSVALAVGPEGGFTGEEIELAVSQGWNLVGLGSRILRVETAALYLIAAITSRDDS